MKKINKSHKNAVDYHKDILESKFNYRCKKEFNLPRNGMIKQLDCACFSKDKSLPNVAMEFESTDNWNNPQVLSNSDDLKKFAQIFSPAKIFHKHVSEIIDFNKEIRSKNKFGVN